jgi:hypothetical protein
MSVAGIEALDFAGAEVIAADDAHHAAASGYHDDRGVGRACG